AVLCWGRNTTGQLGDGTTRDHAAPAPVVGLTDAIGLAAGGDVVDGFVCALRRGGRVSCWGTNHVGQLGDGTFEERHAPVEVVELDDATQITAGYAHACALRA